MNERNLCSTYMRPVLQATDYENKTVYLYQPGCKQWTCKVCAYRNKQFWSAKVGEGIRHYKESGVDGWRFITITSHEKLTTFQATVAIWPNQWRNLSNRLRYRFKGFKYVLLPEKHKDNRLHVHMLASGGIGQTWLKKNARKSGLGYMAESEDLGSISEAIGYVTKYVTKTLEVENWPNKFRRIRTSIRWPKLDDQADFERLPLEWSYLSTYPSDGLEYLKTGIKKPRGFDVKVISE